MLDDPPGGSSESGQQAARAREGPHREGHDVIVTHRHDEGLLARLGVSGQRPVAKPRRRGSSRTATTRTGARRDNGPRPIRRSATAAARTRGLDGSTRTPRAGALPIQQRLSGSLEVVGPLPDDGQTSQVVVAGGQALTAQRRTHLGVGERRAREVGEPLAVEQLRVHAPSMPDRAGSGGCHARAHGSDRSPCHRRRQQPRRRRVAHVGLGLERCRVGRRLARTRQVDTLFVAVPADLTTSPSLTRVRDLVMQARSARSARGRPRRRPRLGRRLDVGSRPLAPTAVATGLFTGLHVDVEPWTTAAWTTRRSTTVDAYSRCSTGSGPRAAPSRSRSTSRSGSTGSRQASGRRSTGRRCAGSRP